MGDDGTLDPLRAAIRAARSDTAVALLTKLMASVRVMTDRHTTGDLYVC